MLSGYPESMLLLLLALYAVAAVPASHGPVCDASMLPSCEKLAAAHLDASHDVAALGLPVPRDGGAVFNAFNYSVNLNKSPQADVQLSAAQTALMRDPGLRSGEANAIAEDVRRAAISMVTNGALTSSPEQKALISRLSSVTIDIDTNPPDLCGEKAAPRGFPEAAYDPATHTLFICRAAQNITEKQLVHTLAHEFGHSVSPCKEQQTLYKFNSEKLYEAVLHECFPNYFSVEHPEETVPNAEMKLIYQQRPAYAIRGKYSRDFKDALDCGIVAPVANSSFKNPVLFKLTEACLIQKHARARTTRLDDAASQQSIARHISTARARASEAAATPPECESPVEENFADSFEAKLIGQIATNPEWRKGHPEATWKSGDYAEAILEKAGYACAAARNPAAVEDPRYPKAHDRVETILDDPTTRKIMGCERPRDTKLCPLEFGSNASKTMHPTAPTKRAN